MARHQGRPAETEARQRLSHKVETFDDATACTLFPAACAESDIVTHWITAMDDAFVDLESMR